MLIGLKDQTGPYVAVWDFTVGVFRGGKCWFGMKWMMFVCIRHSTKTNG